MTVKLDGLEHAVARALRDGRVPWAYLPHAGAGVVCRTIKRLHAKGYVRYEEHEYFNTPVITDAGLEALKRSAS